MSQEPLGVGADIDVECSQCGLFTHIIVAKVGNEIAKIACKRCGRSRRLRAAEKEKLFGPKVATSTRKSSAVARSKPARTGSGRTGTGRSGSRTPAPLPIDPNKPAERYRPQLTFRTGEYLEHPSFGRGRVESLVAPGKIAVQFSDGVRILIHGRSEVGAPDTARTPV